MSRQILFILADGEHARFVRPAADNALHTEREYDATTAHKPSSALGSDHPGASYHTGSTAHHAMTPRHDPHELAQAAFATSVAKAATEILGEAGIDAVVVAAPADILAIIQARLAGLSGVEIIGTLQKDLVKIPDHLLWSHLRDWVPPVRRPTS